MMKPIKNIKLLPHSLETPEVGKNLVLSRPDLDCYQAMSHPVNHQQVHEKEKERLSRSMWNRALLKISRSWFPWWQTLPSLLLNKGKNGRGEEGRCAFISVLFEREDRGVFSHRIRLGTAGRFLEEPVQPCSPPILLHILLAEVMARQLLIYDQQL